MGATVQAGGFTLALDDNDSLGLGAGNLFEQDVLAALERAIRPGDRVVDVGANIGYFTLHAARLAGVDGEVVAFEPEPRNFALLQKNVAANRDGAANVRCLQVALGAEPGELLLHLNSFNGGMHRLYPSVVNDGGSVRVRVATLDSVLAGSMPVDVMKIDVEGFEAGVLMGAGEVLGRSPAVRIVMEFCAPTTIEAGFSPTALLEYLSGFGLQPHELDGTPIPLEMLLDQAHRFESQDRDAVLAGYEGLSGEAILQHMLDMTAALGCPRPFIENLLFQHR